LPFNRIRSNIDGSKFYYNTQWRQWSNKNNIEYDPFDITKRDTKKKYVYYYKVYNPSVQTYPLPEYIGSIPYIETSIEIANFHLNNIKNGFWGGSMITFTNGQPTNEERDSITSRFKRTKAGTDNAGRFVINFVDGDKNLPKIDTLVPSDNDKMFDILNKTCLQEIFVGHRITSPMLFGVRVEGQLGGRDEIVEAYEMFKKTYVKNRQNIICKILNYHIKNNTGIDDAIYLEPSSPIDSLDVNGQPMSSTPTLQGAVNEHLKNLTGRQMQHLDRIVRKFQSGKYSLEVATALLRSSLGMSDEDIRTVLGNNNPVLQKMGKQKDWRVAIEEFKKYGKDISTFTILRKSDFNLQDDDFEIQEQYFSSESDLKAILKALSKNSTLTPDQLAEQLSIDLDTVKSLMLDAIDNGQLKQVTSKDTTQSVVTEKGAQVIKNIDTKTTKINTYYEYGLRTGIPKAVSGSREFCKEMMQLQRLYTRKEINLISDAVGYSAWLMRGGWYHNPSTDVNEPFCRHIWKQVLVVEPLN
jgi:predicted transcriptional regulator